MPSATPESSAPRIVLGVAGGIAAYKSVELLRLLRDANYYVAPILTADATRFVGASTFSALANEPARTNLFGDPSTPIPHTYLGRGADLIVVAPATANLIARYAIGLANDLLSATLLATNAPVLLCAAMHSEMWVQPSVQENLATLRRRGVMVLEPEVGHLAGGDEGVGRMAEPSTIFDLVEKIVRGYRGPLSGTRLLISAGGTREAIDPVRVISNRSSGHQGFALAEVATRLGADVTLVSTVDRDLALDVVGKVTVVRVESALEMREALLERFKDADAAIMAAAVSDFTLKAANEKIKKDAGVPTLDLELTADIVVDLVAARTNQVVVAFAAETANVLANAQLKLSRKKVDLLVVNDVSAPDTGFEHATNEVVILGRDGVDETVTMRSKEAVALAILTRVASLFSKEPHE